MIALKDKTAKKIRIYIYLLFFGLCVFSVGFFYLESRLQEKIVSENVSDAPYYSEPENFSVFMQICEDKMLLSFNFLSDTVDIYFSDENMNSDEYDYYINCDYETVGYFVDIVGGIELENIRYTGVEITEILQYTVIDYFTKKEITQKIINGISENGIKQKDIIYLIENSQTNLKFNECFLVIDYIPKLCEFIRFIN